MQATEWVPPGPMLGRQVPLAAWRAPGTHQHYTYPKRNVKGSSPCGQEESTGKGKAHLERQIESKSRHMNAMTRFFLEARQRLQAVFLSYHSDIT